MKIGISIAPLLEAKKVFPDIQELIELFITSEIGIKNFEIHRTPDILQEKVFENLRKLGANFSIHLPHVYTKPSVNLCSSNKKDLQRARQILEKSIQLAKELKAKNIVLHPDIPKKISNKQGLKILKEHINYGLKLLNKNMFLLVENMPGKSYPLYSPLPMKKFVDSFNSKQIGICWDVGHAKLAIKNKFLEFPRILKKRIKEVHIVDVIKEKNKLTDHHPLGSGILNFNKIIKELKKAKFNGLIIMEIIPKEVSEIKTSIKILKKAIKKV